MSSDQLISINDLVKKARQAGISFGFGDPKVHLAYLTKLRLLPQSVRRKINGKIAGCYPEDTIARLHQIEELKNRGLTYSQIKYQLDKALVEESAIHSLSSNFESLSPIANHFSSNQPNAVAFLIVGLLLGYLLAGLNTINSNANKQSVTTVLPAETKAIPPVSRVSNQVQPVYLIALPDENLYKLGKINFADLIKQP